RNRARSLLIVTEVALALVLLVGAGLLIRSLSRLLEVNPGFTTANLLIALVNHPPLTGWGGDVGTDIMIEDDIKPWTNAQPHPAYRPVSTNYLQLMGIPLLSGRSFNAADFDGSLKVVIISETMAKQLWLGKDPVGRRLTYSYETDGTTEWLTVVGVA